MAFNFRFWKSDPPPPASPPVRTLRDTLFGDGPIEAWPPGPEVLDETPWDAFRRARAHLKGGRPAEAVAEWRRVVALTGLESRHYLQAWHFLRAHGVQPEPAEAKRVWGVVVEVGVPDGLDLLAAYPEGTARYYNYSGRGVVWEHPDTSLDPLIGELLARAQQVTDRIGPWEGDRPPPPSRGELRLCFLTASGLHFGQGQIEVLAADPLGGAVFQVATQLMQALIAKQTGT